MFYLSSRAPDINLSATSSFSLITGNYRVATAYSATPHNIGFDRFQLYQSLIKKR